jgi:PTH1 family peptidyl-tRNA hydrolase
MIAKMFCDSFDFVSFEEDKKNKSLRTDGKISKSKVTCLLPETLMNKSGNAVKKIITSKKKAGQMIVIHDDVDIPIGKFKISYGKGAAGHKGVESVMRAVGTKDFFRVRIGITQTTPKGKLKKPKGEKMLDYLMAKFKPAEKAGLKRLSKKIIPEMETIILGKRTR